MYYEEVEEELRSLKEMYYEGDLIGIKRFMEDWDYEDEFSHNEIEKMQHEFILKAKEFLNKASPNKYKISSGWAVFIKEIN